MLFYGLPVLFNQFLNLLKANVNTWIILAVLGISQVADYGFALKVAVVFSLIGQAFRKGMFQS